MEEFDGNLLTALYIESDDKEQLKRSPITTSRRTWGTVSASNAFRHAFLPEGYPHSVTPDYAPFQLWDTLQGLSTYIRSMISTQVLLAGLGVGQTSATAIGATFQWFVRDFTGMMGGILFALFKGSNLDSYAKQWRLAADIINDIGMLLDLISPLVPGAFLPILCLGSVSRAITGTASGATRAALTQHFALRQNAADIAAKEGSQETLATMVGMLLGVGLAQLTAQNTVLLWSVFLSLTLFHMYANYRAVGSLCLNSLNPERISILAHCFFQGSQVLSPSEVAAMETIVPSIRRMLPKPAHKRVLFAARLSDVQPSVKLEELRHKREVYAEEKYVLFASRGAVCVLLSMDSASEHHLRAFTHALILLHLLPAGEGASSSDAERDAAHWMRQHYSHFVLSLREAQWKTDMVLLSVGGWRFSWLDFRKDE